MLLPVSVSVPVPDVRDQQIRCRNPSSLVELTLKI